MVLLQDCCLVICFQRVVGYTAALQVISSIIVNVVTDRLSTAAIGVTVVKCNMCIACAHMSMNYYH